MTIKSIAKGNVAMTTPQLINYLNQNIKESEKFLFSARSSRLQLEQCFLLDDLLFNVFNIHLEAIRRKEENEANLFLGYKCVIGGIRSELMMWILLKRDMPNEAWDCLVSAQMASIDAARAHIGFEHCAKKSVVLGELENNLFPPQSFLSAGFISDKIDCSICGKSYSSCDHLHGKPYMGEFCEVIHRNIRGDHVAIVDVPADKRCRVISIKTKDGYQDKLSCEIKPYENDEVFNGDEVLEAKTILMALDRYPYLSSTEKLLGSNFLASQQKK